MEEMHIGSEARVFAAVLDQFAALHEGTVTGAVTAGHHDLGPDIWLSSDPAGRAAMSCQPCEQGIRLSLAAGDSGAWACLGMRLSPEVLRRGRYLGVLFDVHSDTAISFTPTLRYFPRDGGMVDVATAAPVFLPGGQREHLSHIPLDPAQLEAASGCELNLFFHTDAFDADFHRIEPLLIL